MTIVNRRNAVIGWVDAEGVEAQRAPQGEAGPRAGRGPGAGRTRLSLFRASIDGPRPVRAGQAGRGGAAGARARSRRQARLERGAVPAVPGGARGDGARGARAQPLSGRRRLGAPDRRSPSDTASPSRSWSSAAGADGIIDLLAQATLDPGDDVVCGWPSFPSYVLTAAKLGAEARRVPLRDHTYDLDGLLAAIGPRTKLVYVCHPNNPTGTANGRAELLAFLDRLPEHVLCVLDQAYFEYIDDPDYADGIELFREGRRLVVLRTFSKIYGLAGLRVGWAVAPADVATATSKVRRAFDVAATAQAAALASLDDPRGDRAAAAAERGRPRPAGRDPARATGSSRPGRLAATSSSPTSAEGAACSSGCSARASSSARSTASARPRRSASPSARRRRTSSSLSRWDTSFRASRNQPASVVRSGGSS